MNPEMIEEVVEIFKVLSDPTRLGLLLALRDGEMNVGELAVYSKTSLANVSKHLSFMRRTGIVTRRKVKNQVYYNLRSECVLEICDTLCRDYVRGFKTGVLLDVDRKTRDAHEGSEPGPEKDPHERKAEGAGRDLRESSEGRPEVEILQPRLNGLNEN